MKNKILYAIIAIIIIVGAVLVYTQGFNFSLKYQNNQKIEIYIGKEFNKQDVKEITDEVFENAPVNIQTVELYKDTVAITAKEITDEQKTSIVEKMNEKYTLELKAEDLTIEDVPHIRLLDTVKPYILPFIIATLVILAYLGIRFYKLGFIKVILKAGIIAVIAQLVAFSIMAITRIPIGEYTMAISIAVYFMTMIGITSNYEDTLKRLKESDNEKIEEN